MRAILAIAIVCLLCGFGSCSVRQNKPVPALIDASCFQPVKDDVRWECDANDPACWDVLAGEVVPRLREKIGQSDAHRLACEQGLRRLDKARVIDLWR
jgi:hypothetical protein